MKGTRRNVLHRATKYVKYAKIWCVDRVIKGKPETLINMGSEVDLPPGCIRTVPHINRGGTFYNGRLNMSNMEILGM